MIKANEAMEMVKTLRKQDEEALNAKAEKFCDEVCDKAIRDAITDRQFCCAVDIPHDMRANVARIVAVLITNGFKAQASGSYAPSISICWNV